MILATTTAIADEALRVGAAGIAAGGAVDRDSELSPVPRAVAIGPHGLCGGLDLGQGELGGVHG